MKNLVICEFPWQVQLIKPRISEDDIVISFNAETNYELERNGINFSDARDYYDHCHIWSQYPDFTHRTARICNRLDQIFWKVDPELGGKQLKLSDLLFYQLKIAIGQAFYKIHVSREILRRHAPTGRVTIASAAETPILTNFLLFDGESSILSWIFGALQSEMGYQIQFLETPETRPNSHQGTRSRLTKGIGKAIRKLQRLKAARFPFPKTPPPDKINVRLLSVNCPELDTLKGPLLADKICVETYQGEMFHLTTRTYPCSTDIIEAIEQDATIKDQLTFEGLNASQLIFPILSKFVKTLDRFLEHYKEMEQLLDATKPDCVFVQSLAPFHLSNILLAQICDRRNIPLVCWMHGGYGAYHSLTGYDVTDFRLGINHFVYGKAVSDILASEKCVLNQLGFNGHNLYVSGAPAIEQKYRTYVKPKNSRKRVLLPVGNLSTYNQFHFGYNRRNAEYCSWEYHRVIIELFVRYQDRYEFVIKDYPNPKVNMKDTWSSLLKDLGGRKIRLVTDEERFEDLLVKSDLCVFTWVSTTFIESLLTDADIFLLDDSDITDEARALFEAYIEFSDNIPQFVAKLDRYLDVGRFYSQDKGLLRDYFVDYSHKDDRPETVARMIDQIVDRPEAGTVPGNLTG